MVEKKNVTVKDNLSPKVSCVCILFFLKKSCPIDCRVTDHDDKDTELIYIMILFFVEEIFHSALIFVVECNDNKKFLRTVYGML